MRSYQVPPDMKEKEKIIGGVLNLNQFFWLVGGFAFGIVLFMLTFVTMKIAFISIFFALVGFGAFAPFAFYKKKDLTLYLYITRKRKFKKKTHKLINHRKGVSK